MLFIESQTGNKPKSLKRIYGKTILYSNRSPILFRIYYYLLLRSTICRDSPDR